MITRISLFSILFFISSCTKDNDEMKCYGLNNVQCSFYPWEESLKPGHSEEDRIKAMKEFLSDKDIRLSSAKYNPNFHGVVCLACEVCPRGDRYEIQLESKYSAKLEALKLTGNLALNCNN